MRVKIKNRKTPFLIEENSKVMTPRNLLLIFILFSPNAVLADTHLTTIGWIESVRIIPEGFYVQAKIDTGADNSSIDVLDWQSFNRNGAEWVRFNIRNNDDVIQAFERPLLRIARIKRKQSEALSRPVVQMWLCIGDKKFPAQVNLAKRGNFEYRMLIGRSYLKGRFLVDSASRLTLSPQCETSP